MLIVQAILVDSKADGQSLAMYDDSFYFITLCITVN